MNKKTNFMIAFIVAIFVIVAGVFLLVNNNNQKNKEKQINNNNSSINESTNREEDNNKENTEEEGSDTTTNLSNKKVLVVYFSATSNTKNVAEVIANNINGDLFEIEPKDPYTSEDLNYGNKNSRVSKEHDDKSLRNIELKKTEVENWDSYDTVFIGYPIWWQVAAWPVDTFVKANNFDGKTVIPFCTSASSGLGESGKLLEEESNGGNWLEGHRFSSYPSESEIKTWLDTLK